MDPYAWPWNPEALIVVPGIAGGYALAVRRFGAPWWRIGCAAVAVALLLAVTVTPIHTLAVERLLLVHLLQNVVLAEWAPLLLLLALTPAMAGRVAAVPGVRIVTHPAVALPLWAVNYALWHVPPVYDAALRSPHGLLHLEHACYLATGLAMWWPVVHDVPRRLAPARVPPTSSVPSSSPARSASCSRSFRSRCTASTRMPRAHGGFPP